MPNLYKKISEETIHKNPWWEYKRDMVELHDGSQGEYYYGESNGGALVVPILDDGRLVLVSQRRYLADRTSVEFPCGSIDDGEAPQPAAERELLEESGYKSSNFLKVGAVFGLIGLMKSPLHIFVADELEKVGEPQSTPTENLETMYRRVDEFEEMIRRGEIIDGPTLMAWALCHERVVAKVSEILAKKK